MMRTQWEYKIIKLEYGLTKGILPTQTELYLLGREGWEVAGVWGQTGQCQVILKRPLEAKEDRDIGT